MSVSLSPTATTHTASASSSSSSASSSSSSGLDKNAFMKILITQMQNQDPTSPMDDTAFVAQMAQFSALEQMTNVSDGVSVLEQMQVSSQALSLVGHTVTITNPDGKGDPISGKVDCIKFDNGVPKIVVGGKEYDVSGVTSVQ